MRVYFNIIISCLLAGIVVCLMACNSHSPADEPEPQPESVGVKVLEYCPAMGQFVNVLPLYEDGDTHESMCRKVESMFADDGVISLGGFGGYVTMWLGEPIPNTPEKHDFMVKGNAFFASGSETMGNSEPGVVWVSQDLNNNNLPDDEWYQLAGSEYYKPETDHHYKKTWYKSDTTLNNPFHRQPYFPQWIADTVIQVEGTCLHTEHSMEGGVIAQQILTYGYVDNRPNSDTLGISFDLEWAVDDKGEHVELEYCDFVRVVTAVDKVYSGIGELSTEVGKLMLFPQ